LNSMSAWPSIDPALLDNWNWYKLDDAVLSRFW
jgi:hypothetical protein